MLRKLTSWSAGERLLSFRGDYGAELVAGKCDKANSNARQSPTANACVKNQESDDQSEKVARRKNRESGFKFSANAAFKCQESHLQFQKCLKEN